MLFSPSTGPASFPVPKYSFMSFSKWLILFRTTALSFVAFPFKSSKLFPLISLRCRERENSAINSMNLLSSNPVFTNLANRPNHIKESFESNMLNVSSVPALVILSTKSSKLSKSSAVALSLMNSHISSCFFFQCSRKLAAITLSTTTLLTVPLPPSDTL